MRPSTQGAKVAGDWTDSRLEIDPTPSQVREHDPLCAFSFIPLHIPVDLVNFSDSFDL